MKLIEQYQISDNGYHPFLIRDGWQVAQLNYTSEQEIGNIKKLDIHHLTDEVFILLKGTSVLIGAEIKEDQVEFEVELLKPFVTYNIPAGTWHNIAMEKGSEIIIIEKSNTHLADFEYFQLRKNKQEELKRIVNCQYDSLDI